MMLKCQETEPTTNKEVALIYFHILLIYHPCFNHVKVSPCSFHILRSVYSSD